MLQENGTFFRFLPKIFMKNIAESAKRAYLCIVLIQQLIVLHLKTIYKNEEACFHVRSFRSYFFRILWF